MMTISNRERQQTIAEVTLLSDTCTPVSAFHTLTQGSDRPAFLLESSEGDHRLARYSFVGIDPCETISLRDGIATITDLVHGQPVKEETFANPLTVLQAAVARHKLEDDAEKQLAYPFSGGLVGYSGYGLTRHFEGIDQQQTDPFQVPDAFYGVYDAVVVFDHQYRRIHIVSRRGQAHADQIAGRLRNPSSLPALPVPSTYQLPPSQETCALSPEEFKALVQEAQGYIAEGQVFQIVVAQRFALPAVASALDIYRILQALNPSPYAYLLRLPGFEYLGSSPETFVKCEEGQVLLRAIAGTRRRGRDAAEDALMAEELQQSEKELAEHHMLVDLGRNDLGRVCRVGSVKPGALAQMVKYTHVMHLATEISGALAPDKTCFDVFRSCFPRGTVSGAPKVRAMELLSRLEKERRGVYSGVVGYFDFRGNIDGAIAIRSALIKDGVAHVTAGAGVVFDSVPHEEYLETCNKARSVLQSIAVANTLAQGGQLA